MARVAQLMEEKIDCDFVDINMGCPIDLIYRRVVTSTHTQGWPTISDLGILQERDGVRADGEEEASGEHHEVHVHDPEQATDHQDEDGDILGQGEL